jgi:ankyrin repeat protein
VHIDDQDPNGWTALHYAAAIGSRAIILLLAKHGINVDQQDKLGRTALHYAANHRHLDAITALLECQANIDAQDRAGATPLFVVVDEWDEDTPSYTYTPDLGLDFPPDVVLFVPESALQLMLGRSMAAIRLLLQKGANKNIARYGGDTIFHCPSFQKHLNVADHTVWDCLSSGGHFCAKDAQGQTPLHVAVKLGLNTMVARLLQRGGSAEINAPDTRDAETPLHYGVRNSDSTADLVLCTLLEHGADLNVQNAKGDIPVKLAIRLDRRCAAVRLFRWPTLRDVKLSIIMSTAAWHELLSWSVSQDSGCNFYWDMLANSLWEAKQFEQAVTTFEKAIDLRQPTDTPFTTVGEIRHPSSQCSKCFFQPIEGIRLCCTRCPDSKYFNSCHGPCSNPHRATLESPVDGHEHQLLQIPSTAWLRARNLCIQKGI